MREYTFEQFSLSTAEDEQNYFTGQPDPIQPDPSAVLIPGVYRVIDGRLYRIVGGLPPELQPTNPKGHESKERSDGE